MIHNNESMKTVVETFYVEETTNLIHDSEALKTWNEKVEELQLKGQKTVVTEDKSPIPFLWMNDALIATIETLCPTKVLIENYDKSPIPVELLEAVSLCRKENHFDKIEVWYNEKQKDPTIIGYKYTHGDSDWMKNHYAKKYLIGRWADVKESLDMLVKKAKQVWISMRRIELTKTVRNAQREIEDIELIAADRFDNAMPATALPF